MFKAWLSGLSRGARTGLAIGVIAILAGTGGAAWWLLRTEYQVLFVNLAPQDASVMLTELERMKVPHKLGADGTSILVDRRTVHETRIALMSRDLALHGAVGFELFNTSDFGMTEFAQKVNYQRALQGELTRTIASLAEIETVRVHLVLPDDGLFRRDDSRSKASITVTPKAGRTLRPAQVAGIQRLVAAAVPGIAIDDVTIIDQQGVALTRHQSREEGGVDSQQRLELKRETEQYLGRKASAVLEQVFGPGEALASVDVTLNMDLIKSTSEEVLGAPASGTTTRGVVVRERETVRDGIALERGTPSSTAPASAGSLQRELDYQVGRRIEHVVTAPGSIRRIQVVAAIRKPLDGAQTEQVRQMVAAAVGAAPERGDTVVVQLLSGLSPSASTGTLAPVPSTRAPARTAQSRLPSIWSSYVWLAGLVVLVGMVGLAGLRRRRGHAECVVRMDDKQRRLALTQIERWLDGTETPPARIPGNAS